jgi:putative endonuclease
MCLSSKLYAKSGLFDPMTSNLKVKCPVVIPPGGNWLCYILCCADDTLYTGITNNLEKRLAAHNAGTATKYTRARGPVELVFVESCADKSSALKREIEIKSQLRAEKLILIESATR